jgi:hypothetical protein
MIYYYVHTINRQTISQKHEDFLLCCTTSIIEQNGCSIKWVSDTINTFFSLTEEEKISRPSLIMNMMTCLDLFSEIITLVSQNVKYRRDFRYRSSQNHQTKENTEILPVESFDFDLCNLSSGSGDCEDCDRLSSLIFEIIEFGRADLNVRNFNSNKSNDIMVLSEYSKTKEYNSRLWKNDILNALQLITLFYVNSSVITSSTIEGVEDSLLISEDHSNNKNNDIFEIGSEYDLNSKFGAHMFSIYIPWKKFCIYLSRTEVGKQSKIHEHIYPIFKDSTSLLPTLCIESTGRMRAFLISSTDTLVREIRYRDNNIPKIVQSILYLENITKKINAIINSSHKSRYIIGDGSFNIRRTSPLMQTSKHVKKRHVSTFYRTIAHLNTSKIHKIDDKLGSLVLMDLEKNRWGCNLTNLLNDDNYTVGLLPYFDRFNNETTKPLNEHVNTILNLLPPIRFEIDTGYWCKNFSFFEWVCDNKNRLREIFNVEEIRNIPKISTEHIDIDKYNDNVYYIQRLFVPKSFITSNNITDLVMYCLDLHKSDIVDSITVFDQLFFPLFGRDEFVIAIRVKNLNEFYSFHK